MYSARILLISAALMLAVTACDQEQTEKLDRAGEHLGKAAKNAGDAALDAAEKAGNKVEQWTDQAVDNREGEIDKNENKPQNPSSQSSDNPR